MQQVNSYSMDIVSKLQLAWCHNNEQIKQDGNVGSSDVGLSYSMPDNPYQKRNNKNIILCIIYNI